MVLGDFRRQNPNHWLALTRLGRGLSVKGCCWGFETRPRKYRRHEAIIFRFAASVVNSERGLRPCLLRSFFWFWKCSRVSPPPMEYCGEHRATHPNRAAAAGTLV